MSTWQQCVLYSTCQEIFGQILVPEHDQIAKKDSLNQKHDTPERQAFFDIWVSLKLFISDWILCGCGCIKGDCLCQCGWGKLLSLSSSRRLDDPINVWCKLHDSSCRKFASILGICVDEASDKIRGKRLRRDRMDPHAIQNQGSHVNLMRQSHQHTPCSHHRTPLNCIDIYEPTIDQPQCVSSCLRD